MTEVDNKKLVSRLYEEGWGRGNLNVFDEIFAPQHVLHWNELTPSDQKRTVVELKAIVKAYRNAFPDLKVETNNVVAEGDKVAVQVTFIGTHERPYEGFQPTHKQSRFTDIQILTFSGGKICESSLGSGGLSYFYQILNGEVFK